MTPQHAHTTGPWVFDQGVVPTVRFEGHCHINGDNWFGLAQVAVECNGEPSLEGEANARLIAAAPELYAALREMCNVWGGGNDDPVYIEGRRALSLVEPTP